jgi:hypothetical protein
MGAFYLADKCSPESVNRVKEEFSSQGFRHCFEKSFNGYSLLIFRKRLELPPNFLADNNKFIGAIGTPVYKGLSYSKSLESLFGDFLNKKLNYEELIGHYFIFLSDGEKFVILNDGTSLISAYHDLSGTFLTSSFIIAASVLNKISLNRQAVIENLVTGGIAGDNTLINELRKYSKKSVTLFPSVDFAFPEFNTSVRIPCTKEEALEFQEERLHNYFSDCKQLADEYGADTGLTGGFDSRLLLGCIKNQFATIQIHSHRRNQNNIEWDIAEEIARVEKVPFVSPEVRSFSESTEEELSLTMESSYQFYDSQIRIHCNWNEEYNTLEYRLKVLNDKALGFHGIGGEQYRNSERFFKASWNLRNWIKFNLIRRTGGDVFTSKQAEDELIGKLQAKINDRLGYSEERNKLSIGDLKRINNEIFIPSFRGARTSAENRVSFFLSPFADAKLSAAAYEIIPFLDCTNNFEIELIRKISPALAVYNTNYGYSLEKGEPFLKYFVTTLFENYLPSSLNWSIREKIKHRESNTVFTDKIDRSPLLTKCMRNVKDLDLPLNLEKLLMRSDTAPLVLSMGYFLEKFNFRLN